MKHISSILENSIAPAVGTAPPSAALPAPESLSAEAATTLGSQLLRGGVGDKALPFLARGLRERPSAFAWCRLGKAFREHGSCTQAVWCYDEALTLEPENRWAVIGRAGALAEADDVPFERLVVTYTEVVRLLGHSADSVVVWTAYSVMRAISRVRPDPVVTECVQLLRRIADHLDSSDGRQRSAEIEKNLDAMLRVAELLGESGASVIRSADRPAIQGVSRAELGPGASRP